jgi:hypothetical protein
MEIVEAGTRYRIKSANGEDVDIIFCHSKDGAFVDGITSEELLKVLLNRHRFFALKVESVENINVWTHLDQAAHWLARRTSVKFKRKNFKRKKTKKNNDGQGNAV